MFDKQQQRVGGSRVDSEQHKASPGGIPGKLTQVDLVKYPDASPHAAGPRQQPEVADEAASDQAHEARVLSFLRTKPPAQTRAAGFSGPAPLGPPFPVPAGSGKSAPPSDLGPAPPAPSLADAEAHDGKGAEQIPTGNERAPFNPATNGFNRGTAVAVGEHPRPGVEIGKQEIFSPVKSSAPRYMIDTQHGPDTAHQIDTVEHTDQLLVNPAARPLTIAGRRVSCVMTNLFARVGTGSNGGSAWMIAQDLDKGAELAADATYLGGLWGASSQAVGGLKQDTKNMTRLVFRKPDEKIPKPAGATAGVTKLGPSDDNLFVRAGEKSANGNRAKDYLPERVRHLMPEKSGKHVEHVVKKDAVINICLNLPSDKVPAVATDVASPDESFFVDGTNPGCIAQVGLYHRGQDKTKQHVARLQTWVFGFVGKGDGKGGKEPDTSRFGWVPLVDLQPPSK